MAISSVSSAGNGFRRWKKGAARHDAAGNVSTKTVTITVR
jgi:hypothetical protein